jgi:hypothetical protein
MRTFMSKPKGDSVNHQDMKLYAYATRGEAGSTRPRP